MAKPLSGLTGLARRMPTVSQYYQRALVDRPNTDELAVACVPGWNGEYRPMMKQRHG